MIDTATIPGRLELTLADERPTDLRQLRGIGKKTKKRLCARGISDQLELLLYIPRKYRPTYRYHPGPRIVDDRAEWVEAFGHVTNVTKKRGRRPMEVCLDVNGATFKLLWFNLPYRNFARVFKPDHVVHFQGKVDYDRGVPTLAHPTAKVIEVVPDRRPKTELVPVYGGIEDVHDSVIKKGARQACELLAPHLAEGLPEAVLDTHDLPSIEQALRTIHVLDAIEDLDRFRSRLRRARNRLIFQEFFDLQMALTKRYVEERRAACAPQCTQREPGRDLVRNLPFRLTDDQKQAIATIADELESRVPMRRLLQGDVGSGKTVVALMAAAIACGSGTQTAIMAPTEILARQHLRRVEGFFSDLRIEYTDLVGSQTAAERRQSLQAVKRGHARLVIGTHALVQDGVEFDHLGLIVVDEEHKFGVEQRQKLLELGRDPHLLSMTATPIPRSLAHAAFGDRDLTVIRQKPPGRKPVRTVLRDRSRAPRVYEYVAERIEKTGQQAYFVYPLVEKSDAAPHRKNVIDAAERLANGPFKSLDVGILHGRMPGDAKAEVMNRFADGAIDVLCSTTVIEVGVDVPDATLMIVENAELFGLSQLHQLRGRVGRSSKTSMCVLITGLGLTDDARKRLRAMVETNDGFALAERDLEIRGPGEFLGIKQAGLPEFRFGDILRDARWLTRARRAARRILLGDASR